jgi:DNA-binding MarR family transcriptional regulator
MSQFVPPDNAAEIARLREQHIGRLFLQAHRMFSDIAYEKLHQRGHIGLTIRHTALLAHLDLEGTSITTLAERAGITKQAMGQLVTELSDKGYIESTPDPTDGRARQVRFLKHGWEFLQDAYHVKREIEAEYAAILGEAELEQLRTLLQTLINHAAKS